MFIPTTIEEFRELGWNKPDIILVSGDAYIDSPLEGAAVIGQYLILNGFRVGIIAQPDITNGLDISRLGEPALFWGVTGGCTDSMVANYTATKRKRRHDDFTPGGNNDKRPDRALIVYTNLIRRYFKNTVPVVLGGIEASLRRISHYDYWDNDVRRPVLFDAKADICVYGMGERAVLELARRLEQNRSWQDIRGICYISGENSGTSRQGYVSLPSFEEVSKDKTKFNLMFDIFYNSSNPGSSPGLLQKVGDRLLVQNPPSFPLAGNELDSIFEMPYERDVHPYYGKMGEVRALETIRFSIATHRGCCSECSFCSIPVHQGRSVLSRSEESILKEALQMISHRAFRGIIHLAGSPTQNMYGIECAGREETSACCGRSCLKPLPCPGLKVMHDRLRILLRKMRSLYYGNGKPVRVFISSGIRHDLILQDKKNGRSFLNELIRYHVSGQLKLAPEHSDSRVLELMGKPGWDKITDFKKIFDELNAASGKKQYLSYYLMAAHPGCNDASMLHLQKSVRDSLKITPEQVQIFTPTPSTYSTAMYFTGIDPFSGKPVFVEKDPNKKESQKSIITGRTNKHE